MIPVFGEWDKANELPITQYFESARQAAFIRQQLNPHIYFHKKHFYAPNIKTAKGAAINKKKWTRKESGPQTQSSAQRPTNSKPVDEDLYKIPPHLLPGYKRECLDSSQDAFLHLVRHRFNLPQGYY